MGDERIRAAHHQQELAWAAGFWDGEGSCGCYVKKDGRARQASGWVLRSHIGQNHREPLDRFLAAVGVGKVYGPYSKGRKNEHWNYQCTGKAVFQLFEAIEPWLCEPKRQQAEAMFTKFAGRPTPRTGRENVGCPPGCTCKRHGRYSTEGLTEKQIRRREKMREYQARHRAKLKESA